VLLFGFLLVFQTMSLPGQFAYMAQQDPQHAYLRWPAIVVTAFWVLCIQVVIVSTWKLLTLVKNDRIFTDAFLVWVNAIVGDRWRVGGARGRAVIRRLQRGRPRTTAPAVFDVGGCHSARAVDGGDARTAAASNDTAD
jgi:Protein of unknown function (DUF2975)